MKKQLKAKQLRQKKKKLNLCKETLQDCTSLRQVRGAGSQNRVCAGYTEIIGPCIPTQGGATCA